MLFVISIAFAVIGIGARGGLVWAVNEIEEGRAPRLGEAWNAGFARFWSIFGLWLVLVLPLAIAGLVLAALIIVPIAAPLMRGADISPALVIGPACGVLGIGVPLLIVVGLVLGILYITGLRFVVIYSMGTLQAVGEAWRAFRHRLGDHVLMYLISVGLSIVAGLALAIPMLIIAVPTIVPAIVAAARGTWMLFAGMIALFTVLAVVVGIAFTAVWGTFTSAMWTIFFRRLTGREVLVAIPSGYPAPPAVPAPQPVPQPVPAPCQPAVPQPVPAPPAAPAAPPEPMQPPQDAPDA